MATNDLRHPVLLLALRRYCVEHPNAGDTADGVRRWWLAGEQVSLEDVERALAAVVADGTLAERRLPDGRVLYHVIAR